MTKIALSVEKLTKIYKTKEKDNEIKALNSITFDVKQGEIFGLLGPNGSTLFLEPKWLLPTFEERVSHD